jgi:hypothetical protein
MTSKDNQPTEIKDEADLDQVHGAGLHMALMAAPLVMADEEKLGLTTDSGSATGRKIDPSLVVWLTEEGDS